MCVLVTQVQSKALAPMCCSRLAAQPRKKMPAAVHASQVAMARMAAALTFKRAGHRLGVVVRCKC